MEHPKPCVGGRPSEAWQWPRLPGGGARPPLPPGRAERVVAAVEVRDERAAGAVLEEEHALIRVRVRVRMRVRVRIRG